MNNSSEVQCTDPAASSAASDAQARAMARALNANPRYRVVERFDGFPILDAMDVPLNSGVAAVVDVETTGLGPDDKLIELALVVFAYDKASGEVQGVLQAYEGLEDPGMSIAPEAAAVHGITQEMLSGQHLDDARITDLLGNVDFVVAHNAAFDRSMCEKRLEVFKNLPWVCSLHQVGWAQHGIGSAKLEFIAYRLGFFYEAHRALGDCQALLHALQLPLPAAPEGSEQNSSALRRLIQARELLSRRIWALASPFDTKDALRARGYRWSDGVQPGAEKAWWREVTLQEYEQELAWLKSDVYKGRASAICVDDVDAYSRFSSRRSNARRVTL